MRYGEGWAHDPTYSQQKRAKPTYTDPEDDMKVDPTTIVDTMITVSYLIFQN